jgi:hypothetical protein
MRTLFLIVGLLAVAGCQKEPKKPAPSTTMSAEASPPGVDPELRELHLASTRGRKADFSKLTSVGPTPAGSSDLSARKRAVHALFASGSPAAELPVIAVDRGNEYELALRYVLTQGGFDPAPAATLFEVEASGGLAGDEVDKVLATRLRWYEACFIPSLRQDRRATGSVTLRWSVAPEGNVTGVWMVKSDLLAEEVTNCLVRHSHGLLFARPPQGTARVTASVQLGPWKPAGHPNLPRNSSH